MTRITQARPQPGDTLTMDTRNERHEFNAHRHLERRAQARPVANERRDPVRAQRDAERADILKRLGV